MVSRLSRCCSGQWCAKNLKDMHKFEPTDDPKCGLVTQNSNATMLFPMTALQRAPCSQSIISSMNCCCTWCPQGLATAVNTAKFRMWFYKPEKNVFDLFSHLAEVLEKKILRDDICKAKFSTLSWLS